ncbi:MAG: TlpA family protein disulfide reductase [Flavobacteriales bacterium]
MRNVVRSRSSFSFASLLLVAPASAQIVKGTFERPLPASVVVLYATTGSEHPAIDSTGIQEDGTFSFPQRELPAGFYQLGINGDDRIDLVVDPADPVVELAFHGTPLQRNINVIRSADNQRMWAYKNVSRAGQDAIQNIKNERANASPLDTALLRSLDRREAEQRKLMRDALDSLSAIDPNGQFARAVQVDRALDAAIPLGPSAIRKAFDFSDPWTLRSNAYSKATVVYLQNTRFDNEYAFHRACDTLLIEASRDTSCWRYMRYQLVDIFTTYGPDEVAQYLVDTYVVGEGSRVPPEAELVAIAAAQLRMVIGAPAPEARLASPGGSDSTALSSLWGRSAYTALFFYSSTCDHCHAQMPGLRALYDEMKRPFFNLIGIALDANEEEFRTTIVEERLNWPCYSSLIGWGEPAAKAFNVKATPSLFVVDRQGRIAAKPMNHEELRSFLLEKRKR